MDNNAFRALVNERRSNASKDGSKSTREIARHAVEEEFRRRGGGRRRRRGGGDAYGSSSEEEDDKDGNRKGKDRQNGDDNAVIKEPDWKRQRREKKNSTEYRDRAKERREGKTSGEQQLGGAIDDVASLPVLSGLGIQGGAMGIGVDREEQQQRRIMAAELSKYLGGDEEHTHLVKGLDLALAQKVRREMQKEEEQTKHDQNGSTASEAKQRQDLDYLLENALTSKQTKQEQQNKKKLPGQTELGKSMLNYLSNRRETAKKGPSPCPDHFNDHLQLLSALTSGAGYQNNRTLTTNKALQQSIKRSLLTFSLDANVTNKPRSWQVPRLTIDVATIRQHRDNPSESICGSRGTPLDKTLMCSISNAFKNALDGVRGSKIIGEGGEGYVGHIRKKKDQHSQDKKDINSSDNHHKDKIGSNQNGLHSTNRNGEGSSSGSSSDDSGSDIENSNDNGSHLKQTTQQPLTNQSVKHDEDSDDDIFENLEEYVPTIPISRLRESVTNADNKIGTPEKDVSKAEQDAEEIKAHSDVNDTTNDGANNTLQPKSAKGDVTDNIRKKESIFVGLLPETNEEKFTQNNQNHKTESLTQQSTIAQHPKRKKEAAKKVINRDVFGGQAPVSLRHQPQGGSNQRVSMMNYQGGYGEEMDVDFANFEENDGGNRRKLDNSGDEKDDGKDADEDE